MSRLKENRNLVLPGHVAMGLAFEHLTASGLASPDIDYHLALIPVWVLSTTFLPQPGNNIGTWDDTRTWVDTNVWYD